MKKSIVELHHYNPEWANEFQYEKKRITAALGDKIIGIEHIGSTSIKGLKAKPIIDILAGVQDLREIHGFVSPLNEIEFEYVPKPEWKDRSFFRKGLWGQGTCHLHICEFNSKEWEEKLLFRDYLMQHPEAAGDYALIKEELAEKYKFDRQIYTKRKEPFIKGVIEKAKREITLFKNDGRESYERE
ncbi:GrpB family protein [Gracilibacillus caseinilyticus]|uniref:GrpB family protein n=1 Tax=Gracilibacillus caseinilyticus TaxID=2932256 RepID=A0ABY4EX35_9BACI|nr:GrpB family protein [Gracilibacillus caseinilyticus]UOQ48985.1 GrpB family protein [Gracilibacillus caseinilyticus]